MDRATYERNLPKMGERVMHLNEEILEVIDRLDLSGRVRVNVPSLGLAVIDYFEDIEKLKSFEGIERANEAKIYAYTTYWLLRRHPIEALDVEDRGKEIRFINEKVCLSLLLAKAYEEAGTSPDCSSKEFSHFTELLFYNLKYRLFTQKSLELMVEALILGCRSKRNLCSA